MSKIITGSKAINVFEISQIASILGVSAERLLNVKEEKSEAHKFLFMGSLKNEQTKEKIKLLKTIIDEINMLEEYANGDY
jgi:ferritin